VDLLESIVDLVGVGVRDGDPLVNQPTPDAILDLSSRI
jgi:hypothetical protein